MSEETLSPPAEEPQPAPERAPVDPEQAAPAPESAPEAPAAEVPAEAPVVAENAPEAVQTSSDTSATAEAAPVFEAPATGVPLVGVNLPADGSTHEVTLDAAPSGQQLANMQHELAAARDAAVNAQAGFDRIVEEVQALRAQHDADVATIAELRAKLPAE